VQYVLSWLVERLMLRASSGGLECQNGQLAETFLKFGLYLANYEY
jgi:hypothetical protein